MGVLVAGAVAFVASLVLTPVAAALARRAGVLDVPGGRKAHTKATPLLGVTTAMAWAELLASVSRTMTPALAHGHVFVMLSTRTTMEPSPVSCLYTRRMWSTVSQTSPLVELTMYCPGDVSRNLVGQPRKNNVRWVRPLTVQSCTGSNVRSASL